MFFRLYMTSNNTQNQNVPADQGVGENRYFNKDATDSATYERLEDRGAYNYPNDGSSTNNTIDGIGSSGDNDKGIPAKFLAIKTTSATNHRLA
jgi:hypothetical protein